MRRSILFWTVLCATAVVGVYVIKHRVQSLEDRLRGLNAQIISDKNSIHVLDAEWSFLNQPSRLEKLGRQLLGMQSPRPGQTMPLRVFLRREQDIRDGKNGDNDSRQPTIKGTEVADRRSETAPKAPPADEHDWLKPILAKLKRPQ